MRDILPDLDHWRARGEPIALATVIQTWGSSPRGVGARMALTPSGEIAGSVSGGCVEGAVFEAGTQVLETGRPQLLHFGVADETAWEVGLACGGTIDVFVQPLGQTPFDALRAALLEDRPAAAVTVIRGPDPLPGRQLLLRDDGTAAGALGPDLDPQALSLARTALARGQSRRVSLTPDLELFVEALLPSPTLVIVGGVHIAIALASLAKTLGYRTVLVDPRAAFGSQARFPHVDRLVQAWPDEALAELGLHRSTAVACLTHDPKLDDPALLVALPSPAFYVGALGSQKTQRRRRERLLEAGLTAAQLDRLHGPIGLDINARTPEEIALSVMAEIVAARNQRQGSP
ncbi:MAG: XdhC family protein [Chloroflexi bacterium]|nr:XdhC family protein [Chloroflexota bacterium]